MPEHVDENTPYEQGPRLEFRGYRRHRMQSKWGTWALLFPPIAILWTAFWLLMMNQQREAAPTPGLSYEVWVLAIGDGVILLCGTFIASRGLTDTYYKRGRAALALAINLVMFVAMVLAMGLRLFAGSVA